MLNQLDLNHILFLDIETVPEVYKFEELDEGVKYLWNQKMKCKSGGSI